MLRSSSTRAMVGIRLPFRRSWRRAGGRFDHHNCSRPKCVPDWGNWPDIQGEIWGRGATSASCAHGRSTRRWYGKSAKPAAWGSDYVPAPPAVSASQKPECRIVDGFSFSNWRRSRPSPRLDEANAPGLSPRALSSPSPKMAKAPVDPENSHALAVSDAKRLMRLSRTAALATLDPDSGAPLTTLVGVASDFDGAPIFLMSTLARHTRQLLRDPRGSVLIAGEHERGDPLNHPRVTLNGRIEMTDAATARTRYLQRNPKAKLYADFGDFAFYRLAIESVHFNGGFGRAAPLQPADILSPREGEAALVEAEPRLLDAINARGDDFVGRLAGHKSSGRRVWRAIGLDCEGLDLSAGSRAARLQFSRPAHDEASWQARLEEAAER